MANGKTEKNEHEIFELFIHDTPLVTQLFSSDFVSSKYDVSLK